MLRLLPPPRSIDDLRHLNRLMEDYYAYNEDPLTRIQDVDILGFDVPNDSLSQVLIRDADVELLVLPADPYMPNIDGINTVHELLRYYSLSIVPINVFWQLEVPQRIDDYISVPNDLEEMNSTILVGLLNNTTPAVLFVQDVAREFVNEELQINEVVRWTTWDVLAYMPDLAKAHALAQEFINSMSLSSGTSHQDGKPPRFDAHPDTAIAEEFDQPPFEDDGINAAGRKCWGDYNSCVGEQMVEHNARVNDCTRNSVVIITAAMWTCWGAGFPGYLGCITVVGGGAVYYAWKCCADSGKQMYGMIVYVCGWQLQSCCAEEGTECGMME